MEQHLAIFDPRPHPRPDRNRAAGRRSEAVVLADLVGHIERNLGRRISVGELAGVAGVSALQLSRAFRRDYATTPYALVLQIRIGRAKQLLGCGAAIAEAAAASGFADQSHLTRHFRRLVGMTPREYLGTIG